jgi:hypothetical protein
MLLSGRLVSLGLKCRGIAHTRCFLSRAPDFTALAQSDGRSRASEPVSDFNVKEPQCNRDQRCQSDIDQGLALVPVGARCG